MRRLLSLCGWAALGAAGQAATLEEPLGLETWAHAFPQFADGPPEHETIEIGAEDGDDGDDSGDSRRAHELGGYSCPDQSGVIHFLWYQCFLFYVNIPDHAKPVWRRGSKVHGIRTVTEKSRNCLRQRSLCIVDRQDGWGSDYMDTTYDFSEVGCGGPLVVTSDVRLTVNEPTRYLHTAEVHNGVTTVVFDRSKHEPGSTYKELLKVHFVPRYTGPWFPGFQGFSFGMDFYASNGAMELLAVLIRVSDRPLDQACCTRGSADFCDYQCCAPDEHCVPRNKGLCKYPQCVRGLPQDVMHCASPPLLPRDVPGSTPAPVTQPPTSASPSVSPSFPATDTPTATPTGGPRTSFPTGSPSRASLAPSAEPTLAPSSLPTATATGTPDATATATDFSNDTTAATRTRSEHSATATAEAEGTPTRSDHGTETAAPTQTRTARAEPTATQTLPDTYAPTAPPTGSPESQHPTAAPVVTSPPTSSPLVTAPPSGATSQPSSATAQPVSATAQPSANATAAPSNATAQPSTGATAVPSSATVQPSKPSLLPSGSPSGSPVRPTTVPVAATSVPAAATSAPTVTPAPTASPRKTPSRAPTAATQSPTTATPAPTATPTSFPTTTRAPTHGTQRPSASPSVPCDDGREREVPVPLPPTLVVAARLTVTGDAHARELLTAVSGAAEVCLSVVRITLGQPAGRHAAALSSRVVLVQLTPVSDGATAPTQWSALWRHQRLAALEKAFASGDAGLHHAGITNVALLREVANGAAEESPATSSDNRRQLLVMTSVATFLLIGGFGAFLLWRLRRRWRDRVTEPDLGTELPPVVGHPVEPQDSLKTKRKLSFSSVGSISQMLANRFFGDNASVTGSDSARSGNNDQPSTPARSLGARAESESRLSRLTSLRSMRDVTIDTIEAVDADEGSSVAAANLPLPSAPPLPPGSTGWDEAAATARTDARADSEHVFSAPGTVPSLPASDLVISDCDQDEMTD